MKRAVWLFVALSLMFGSLAGTVSAQDKPEGVPKSGEAVTVSAVPNGGTIVVILGDGSTRNVGLIGVTAPAAPTATDPGQCYGEEARLYLESLAIPGTVVYLEADPEVREVDETLLRHVWVIREGTAKAILVNSKMVRDGFADVGQWGVHSKYAKRFDQAQANAEKDDKGAWRACGGMHESIEVVNETEESEYQDVDIREVDLDPFGFEGERIAFFGTVMSVNVAPSGQYFRVGDRISFGFEVLIQVIVADSSGLPVTVVVGSNGITNRAYEGATIIVMGVVRDTHTFVNLQGDIVTQSLIAADDIIVA